ncbi:formate--tetrahydrofolate ligase [archaeon]|nr:MAG: formate--tetrahydrofolate ligase [archaeon]
MATAVSELVSHARDRVKFVHPVPSDILISQSLSPFPITAVAADAGILPEELDQYGPYKAKVHLSLRDRLRDVPDGMPRVSRGVGGCVPPRHTLSRTTPRLRICALHSLLARGCGWPCA